MALLHTCLDAENSAIRRLVAGEGEFNTRTEQTTWARKQAFPACRQRADVSRDALDRFQKPRFEFSRQGSMEPQPVDDLFLSSDELLHPLQGQTGVVWWVSDGSERCNRCSRSSLFMFPVGACRLLRSASSQCWLSAGLRNRCDDGLQKSHATIFLQSGPPRFGQILRYPPYSIHS